ncbi:phage anti-RecBCD protein [Salmonella enterica]|uniref:phage anti-RecBCD protein n=1 Tax=Salmonella enterica TaxID=28901 RepID=UPI003CC80EA4
MVRMTRAAVGNSVSEVLEKFRKNYDLIMCRYRRKRKRKRNFVTVYGLQRKKNASEFTRHPSGHSAKPLTPNLLK